MRHLWYLPAWHLPIEMGPEAEVIRLSKVALFGAQRADELEVEVWQAWERATRQIFGLVAQFGHPNRIHIFAEGMYEPFELLRRDFEQTATRGSVMYRIALGLEALGAHLYAVDDIAAMLNQYLAEDNPLEQALIMRQRDEDFTLKVLENVPDGHVALVMMGADHDTNRLISERAPDFQVVRIGDMEELHDRIMRESRSPRSL